MADSNFTSIDSKEGYKVNGIPLTGLVFSGSTTWDASSIAVGAMEAKDVTVTGATLGDFVIPAPSIDITDLTISASVTAADTVTVVLANNTAGAVDLGSMTIAVKVLKA